jgi:hypothetical protein
MSDTHDKIKSPVIDLAKAELMTASKPSPKCTWDNMEGKSKGESEGNDADTHN